MSPTNLADLPSQQPAPMGLCQLKRGQVDNQLQWSTQTAGTPMQDGNGNPMQIAITPTRRGWWVINAEEIFSNPAATWVNMTWSVRLSPVDLTGWGGPDLNFVCTHSALGWQSSSLDTAFQLEAATAYTATICWESAAAAMNYWTGKDYFYIQGEFLAEGFM